MGYWENRVDNRLPVFLSLAETLGVKLGPDKRILDFGCGTGHYTAALRGMGLECYGCDVEKRFEESESACGSQSEQPVFSTLSLEDYRLPYPDSYFDFIFSDHVMEPVFNYDETVSEMRRVLRQGGIALHIFPSRYRLVESHTKLPLAGCLNSAAWLRTWYALGVGSRTSFAKTSNPTESSISWLRSNTNYLPKRKLLQHFRSHFQQVRFIEGEALRSQGHPNLTFTAGLVSAFHVRVVSLS
jgi:ubiquinone/menaquinone biosynthesis C-methylase UbiE